MEEITNVPVQEPVNQAAPKKKLFGKPEIFMLIVLIFGNAISYLSTTIASLLNAFIIDIGNNMLYMPQFISSFLSNLVSNAISLLGALLPIVIYAVFAYLAYKKLRKAARFLGVVFVATQVTNLIFVAAASILNLITAVFNTEVVTIIMSGLIFITEIICPFISAAIGVFLLMVVEGKIKFKKKEKPETLEEKEAE